MTLWAEIKDIVLGLTDETMSIPEDDEVASWPLDWKAFLEKNGVLLRRTANAIRVGSAKSVWHRRRKEVCQPLKEQRSCLLYSLGASKYIQSWSRSVSRGMTIT